LQPLSQFAFALRDTYFGTGGRRCLVCAWIVFENNSAFYSLIQKEEPHSFSPGKTQFASLKPMDFMGL